MKLSNSKNSSITETDELAFINKSFLNGSTPRYDIDFNFKRYSRTITWGFKTKEERDKVLDIIHKKLQVVEINDTDILI
jgi:hypothetical protein